MSVSNGDATEAPVELTGKVVMKKVNVGSKSEYEAVCLETDNASYVLRRAGGNPFQDQSLQKLKGKTITAKGVISDYLFFMTEFKIQP
ncbi:MAG: hypothetical protein ICV81_21120 [Flavisolibacter sp.]|nr:hypothetical protein [Flavisolibacter sp.]MBD0284793.1 hypothetical protein [Flavisolibacter sp.]MBD0298367.1 hypothetical protein [Flavisolibacter sp.]MBD0352914.1 hypothetical protein [Flavisolibacter sp.]